MLTLNIYANAFLLGNKIDYKRVFGSFKKVYKFKQTKTPGLNLLIV